MSLKRSNPVFMVHHLEYAIQVSSPFLKENVDHLECLQRLATRTVKGGRGLSYEERLERLNLFSVVED